MNLRESCMRETCMYSLSGGRRPARQRASSDPTPMKHSNKDGILSAESVEGRLRLKENALSPDTYPTQSGTARVLWVGEGADRLCLAAIYPREEPDANERPSGSVRGVPRKWYPYRDHHLISALTELRS